MESAVFFNGEISPKGEIKIQTFPPKKKQKGFQSPKLKKEKITILIFLVLVV